MCNRQSTRDDGDKMRANRIRKSGQRQTSTMAGGNVLPNETQSIRGQTPPNMKLFQITKQPETHKNNMQLNDSNGHAEARVPSSQQECLRKVSVLCTGGIAFCSRYSSHSLALTTGSAVVPMNRSNAVNPKQVGPVVPGTFPSTSAQIMRPAPLHQKSAQTTDPPGYE